MSFQGWQQRGWAKDDLPLPLAPVTNSSLRSSPGLVSALEAKAEAVFARRDGGQGAERSESERPALLAVLLDLVAVSLDDDPRRDVRRTVPKLVSCPGRFC